MAVRPQRPLPRLVLFISLLCTLLLTTHALPLQRQQDDGVIEPIPDTESGDQPTLDAPSATPSPTPSQTPPPSASASPIPPSPTPSISPSPIPQSPSPSPVITSPVPVTQPPLSSATPVVTAEPTPVPIVADPDTLDGETNRAAIIWGTLAGALALLLLFLLLCCILRRRKQQQQQPPPSGVYNTADAAVTAPPPPPPAAYLNPDDARNLGPAVDASGAAASGGLVDKAELTGAGDPQPIPLVPRGPTPPPHDYVLGAGPAASRTDFIDIRTRFERDEIGDNSAVLGLVKPLETSTAPSPPPPPPELPPPPPAIVPQPAPSEARVDEALPDREGQSVPITFDSQERLMAGGDGSGAISDAAMSLNAGSIAEESGDVPSLERDPIAISRDRDTTF